MHPVCVKVGHGPCNVSRKGEAERPVERDVIVLQHIVKAAFGAVLSDDGHVGHFEGSTNKLAQVRVIQLPACEGGWRDYASLARSAVFPVFLCSPLFGQAPPIWFKCTLSSGFGKEHTSFVVHPLSLPVSRKSCSYVPSLSPLLSHH